MRTYIILLAISIALTGCSNALYYYDKQVVGVNIEGRPDPSAPVQVSIGLKQRTAIIAPGTCGKDDGNDAVSLASYFKAKKNNDGSGQFGKITISASFATGEAAPSDSQTADSCKKKINGAQSYHSLTRINEGAVQPSTSSYSADTPDDSAKAAALVKALRPQNLEAVQPSTSSNSSDITNDSAKAATFIEALKPPKLEGK